MNGLPTMSGFWPDIYMCREDNIVETINKMLSEHVDDFPNTACVGFTVSKPDKNQIVTIHPKIKHKGDK